MFHWLMSSYVQHCHISLKRNQKYTSRVRLSCTSPRTSVSWVKINFPCLPWVLVLFLVFLICNRSIIRNLPSLKCGSSFNISFLHLYRWFADRTSCPHSGFSCCSFFIICKYFTTFSFFPLIVSSVIIVVCHWVNFEVATSWTCRLMFALPNRYLGFVS